jgi:GTP diphosphokinase / guanosine-3',5'-bis(diphosphate) 3'-diphosphatase
MARIDSIIEGYKRYSSDTKAVENIQMAYQIAWNAHAGQFRRSGEPFIVHPLSVAQILVDLKMDSGCICAALLHDTIEDTHTSYEYLKNKLGREVAAMVNALTSIKTSALAKKLPKEELRADTMRKIFLETVKNVRVIIVKLADRWNNMQTLQYMRVDKRKRIAHETISIYAPIADRLGLSVIRRDLEDLSFSFLDPKSYQKYHNRLIKSRSFLESNIGELKQNASDILGRHGLNVRIYERFKTPYSLFQRDQQHLQPQYHYINIIAESTLECYQTLGVFHERFHPMPGTTIRDYIAIPRSNGYQALHTTILYKEHVYPIQIRSEMMERISTYGILQCSNESSRSRYGAWIKRLGEFVRDEKDAGYLIKGIENIAAQDKIYVCTPQGDYLGFPRDATVLDFAYRIHTDIGHRFKSAVMDDRPCGIFDKLIDGSIVEVILADDYQIRPNWLEHAKTTRSRTAIRAWIEAQKRIRSMEFAKHILSQELEKISIDLDTIVNDEFFDSVLKQVGASDQEDLFVKIGSGTITLKTAMKTILGEENFRRYSTRGTLQASRLLRNLFYRTQTDDVFEITDIHDPYLKFSECCNPLPGDSVVGILSIQHGMAVHRNDCPSVKKQKDSGHQIFKLVWNTHDAKSYPDAFKLECNLKKGLIQTIYDTLESHSVAIRSFCINNRDNKLTIDVEFLSHSGLYSERIHRMMQSVSGVNKVIRQNIRVKGKLTG